MNFHGGQAIAVAISAQRDAAVAETTLIRAQMRALDQRLNALRDLLEGCDAAEAALEGDSLQLPLGAQKPQVSELVLGILRQGPAEGMTIGEITQRIMRRFPLIHPKTPAVAATRLKRSGFANNQNGVWRLTEAGRSRPDEVGAAP